MKRRYGFIILAALLSGMQTLFAQVSVNQLTGAASVVIPIYSIGRGVSVPVSISYDGSGMRVKDVEGTAGMNWSLNAGGQITRHLRGLPDDATQDMAGNPRQGWKYNSNYTLIGTFYIANLTNSNCTDQANDITYINNYFSYATDTEPDIFNVSAPGLSCQLVWDNSSGSFKTTTYMDIKVTPTYNITPGQPLYGAITSFTITNDQGITYTFSRPELTTQSATEAYTGSAKYLRNAFLQYQNGMEYYSAWNLTKIADANGNGVAITYGSGPGRQSTDSVVMYGWHSRLGVGSTYRIPQYTVNKNVDYQLVNTISTINKDVTNEYLSFSWKTNTDSATRYGTGQPVIDFITGMGRYFQFAYNHVEHTEVGYTYNRLFLDRLYDTGANTPVNYHFGYSGVYSSGGSHIIAAPDSTTANTDYWGYYNPASTSLTPSLYVNPSNANYARYSIVNGTAGSDYTFTLSEGDTRAADPGYVTIGAMDTVTYATGGSTIINYESNDYLDVPSGASLYGNGIRAKSIINYDNVTGVRDTTTYSYNVPGGSVSSGKPITLPQYGFNTPYTTYPTTSDQWNFSTLRSQNDLSDEDHTIMYEYVKVQKGGSGNSVTQYLVPATYWDASAHPSCSGCTTADWYPTTDYISQNTCPANYGAIKNGIYAYNFAPNPNYDFERGLVYKQTNYLGTTSAVKASETTYTYSRTGAPTAITGFRFDALRNYDIFTTQIATSYAKYTVFYGTSEQLASQTTIMYDSQGLAQGQSSTVNYTYGSTYHKPLTQSATNSDGAVTTTNYKYVKDYAVTTGTGNVNIEALYHLQQLNINAPVETYTTVAPVTGGTYVTGASLTYFNGYPGAGTSTNYLPSQQLQLVQPTGLASGSFTPFYVSGIYTFKNPYYFGTANFTEYDFTGRLQTADDTNKNVSATYLNYYTNTTAFAVKNAKASEVAFRDFDSDLIPRWTYSPNTFPADSTAGGHTGNYQPTTNGQTFVFSLQKNAQAINYIYSIWLNTTSSASVGVTLTGGGTATGTISTGGSTSGWRYYQVVIPVTALSGTITATATVTCSGTIGVDDILFYPQNAEVATYAYDPTTHFKTAETNTNGVSAYYDNDQWGRLLMAYDQDKYITQRKKYIVPASGVPGFTQQEVVTVSGITTGSGVDGLTLAQKQTSLAYYDGLGRTIQSIAKQSSPLLNDIVQPTAYDFTDRPMAAWLPYAPSSGTAGSYRSTAIADQLNFYNQTGQYIIPIDSAPYSQQTIENSPLQRVLKAGMTGTGFQPPRSPLGDGGITNHYKTITYRPNSYSSDGNIIVWGPGGTYVATTYSDYLLWVTTGTDEDGVQTRTYTDIAGRTILKRQVNGGSNLDTYYIYNNAGMVAFIVPPKAISIMNGRSNWSLAQADIVTLLFTFTYDTHGRLIVKKVPGKGAMNIVYDPLNRPVLIQDANLASAYKWNYIKYDVKNRAISQGIYYDNTSGRTTQAGMQTYVSGMSSSYNTAWYEGRSTSGSTGYYTNSIFPTSSTTPLAYGYFDNYDLVYNGTNNYSYVTAHLDNEVGATTAPIQGMPTMTLKSTVSVTIGATWLLSVQFYDKNLRAVQSQTNNLLNYINQNTVTDYKTVVPDFIGTPTASLIKKVTSVTTTVQTNPSYDNQRRITAVSQRYNGGTPVQVGTYSYNEVGQLVGKKLGLGSAVANLTLDNTNSVGSTGVVAQTATNSITMQPGTGGAAFTVASGAVFSASIAPAYQQWLDYRYNIRGQLLSINNSKLANNGTNQDDPNALFGMEIAYDQVVTGLTTAGYFNGKISAVKWMARNGTNSKGDERAFKYSYDAVDRYTAGTYFRRDSTSTSAFAQSNGWNEGITGYDENGNIQALHRNMSTQGSSYTNTTIDRLLYIYDTNNANQLYKVTDSTSNNAGFGIYAGGSSTGHYTYDTNGNMLIDPYKFMTSSYNVLNKLDEIDLWATTGQKLQYLYNADGTLLRKIATASAGGAVTTTDYIEGFVYVNSTLSYFPTPEGRVTNSGGHLTNEYVISDQQGNARITFNNTAGGNSAKVIQENSYYGFGMVMPGSTVSTPAPPNKNLYNGGSEIQNDFGILPDLMQTFFRNYDAALGRWTAVDPQAESAESMSVYQYAGNNPIMGNDPMGNKVDENAQQYTAYNGRILNASETKGVDWVTAQEQFDMYGGGGASSGGGGSDDYSGFWNAAYSVAADFNKSSNQSSHTFSGDAFRGLVGMESLLDNPAFQAAAQSGDLTRVTANGQGATYWTSTGTAWLHNGSYDTEFHNQKHFSSFGDANLGGFPSFATLLKNYPMPYSPGPYSQDIYFNQCAIRLSIALQKSGVNLSSTRNLTNPGGQTFTKKGEVVGAYNLAMFLRGANELGKPEVFNGTTQNIPSLLNGRTGIIFFQGFLEDGSRTDQARHIDLWNGNGIRAPYYDQMMDSRTIWFWPVK